MPNPNNYQSRSVHYRNRRLRSRRRVISRGIEQFQFQPTTIAPSLSLDKVSIIISCRNEGIYLRKTINSIIRTTEGLDIELVIIDDGSFDNSCLFLVEPRTKLYRDFEAGGGIILYIRSEQKLGVAGSRLLGAQHASGDVLLFHDAHITHQSGWLEALLEPLRDPSVHAVCPQVTNVTERGTIISVFHGGTWNENLSWQSILARPDGVSEVPLSPGGCTAMRRED